MFTNRALGNDDNARLIANIVSVSVARDGVVLFDDLRQGLSASYDPARFYRDSAPVHDHLHRCSGCGWSGCWAARDCARRRSSAHDPSEGGAGAARRRAHRAHRGAVACRRMRLFDHFFARVARAARGANGLHGAERGELWQWLERHAAILPQELDQLKGWYADAHALRKLPLVPLQNLLDNLERRLKT